MIQTRKTRAVMSIGLSLLLTVTASLLLVLLYSGLLQGGCLLLEGSLALSTQSILARYDKALYEKYGLLGRDFSYGSSYFSLGQARKELENLLVENSKADTPLPNSLSMFSLQDVQGGYLGYSVMTDYNMQPLGQQIISLMKYQLNGSLLGSSIAWIQEYEKRERENKIEDKWKETWEEIGRYARDYELWEVNEDNPLDEVAQALSLGIFDRLGIQNISSKEIEEESSLLRRQLHQGNVEIPNDKGIFSNIVLQEYIKVFFSSYQNPKEDRKLDYEWEYVIGGYNKDKENLELVINRIFLMQWGKHYLELVNDPTAYQKAHLFALALVGIFGNEGLILATTHGLLLQQAYEKGKEDTLAILAGDKVSLWGDIRLGYQDYLCIFTQLLPQEVLLRRIGSSIESTLRMEEGYSNFCLDHMVVYIETRGSANVLLGRWKEEIQANGVYGYVQ